MKYALIALVLAVSACGVAGPPVSPNANVCAVWDDC